MALPELAPTAKRHDERPRAPGRADTDATTTIIFAATAGDGAPPRNAKKFWSALLRKGAPRLDGKRYALYGLGDARYGTKYNAFARRLDARLAQLGAARAL